MPNCIVHRVTVIFGGKESRFQPDLWQHSNMDISIEGLDKVYRGGRQALKGIDLRISTGMFGLLGPNGAGKTTLMRILATLLAPTAGKITVNGTDLADCGKTVRKSLGYLPQDFRAFPALTVSEFLGYAAFMCGISSSKKRRAVVESVMDTVGLTEVAGRRIKKLSGGMHRRVGIAQALLGPPDLLIVDEPTVGLDPEERIKLRAELSRIGLDCTIILSTHIVGDISSSCERMAILDEGTIVFDGSATSLISDAQGRVWEMYITQEELESAKARHRVVRTLVTNEGLRIRLVGDKPARDSVESVVPTLEDAYVLFMGDRLGLVNEQERAAAGDPS